ncbi:reverse transcriptase [Gossypium australe]|uniref:Reverse transcriptase n=1 Tax=Gossypium australe TaxID=47621 RepID=A0A5B6WMJ9_9ROSI|nr:reverse transcriptase [Gossypium australe]
MELTWIPKVRREDYVWLEEVMCQSIFRVFLKDTLMYSLMKVATRMDSTGGLGDWAKRICLDRKRRKEFLSSKLNELTEAERSDDNLAELIDTKLQLNLEIDKDEHYWEQRARANWLKLRDRNTAFFHKQATQRRQKTASGSFKTQMSMGATKAPGEDGFPAIFFQKFWHIIGDDVSNFCLQHLNKGMEVSFINSTHIVLLPKTTNPNSLSQFRPISLCNVIYKIMAKTMANRFRGVLEKCIDKVQSVFVPERLISDNVLLAYGILHTLNKKKLGRKGWMAVKLDMSKAYDRVEWPFIHDVMQKMGFDPIWIRSVMNCISTVSYSVLINCQKGDIFHPSRGLRQGDPLSPFLFLMCGEGLSSLLRKVVQEGHLKGVKASRRGPQISHLLFTDDCILFGEANERGARLFKGILREYGTCSGQQVNFDKSTVFFSANTREEERSLMTRILGVQSSNNPERYLGLPNMVGRRKKEAFQNLKDIFKQRIDNWSIRHLSQGGKEVFIKAVLQAIPTYTMACFLLPKTLCTELDSIIAKFWWQKHHGKKGIHWWTWKELWNLPSLTWRSVWAAKGLLQSGLGWRIGKGDQVSIWNDHWIPGTNRIQSNVDNSNTRIELVSSLIDSTTRKWKADLVESTFPENVAKQIIQIPLAEEEHEDFQVWFGENLAEFTVRSAYKLLQEIAMDPSDYLLQPETKNFYRKLWNLQLPSKIIITVWRLSWNFIPNRHTLLLRKVVSDSSCPQCRSAEEDRLHIFKQCPATVQTWQLLELLWVTNNVISNLWEWFTSVFSVGDNSQCRIFCCAIWMIWRSRNQLVHEGKITTGVDLASKVHIYLAEIDGLEAKPVTLGATIDWD